MRWDRRSRLAVPLAVLALGTLPGCSGANVGDISGRVTYQDQPIAFGAVLVVASDDTSYFGVIKDGRYLVEGVPIGQVRFAIHYPDPRTIKPIGGVENKFAQAADSGSMAEKGWFPIPEYYSDPERSGLGTTVVRGANTVDLDLP